MAFINAHNTFSVKSELDLFSTKATQNCVESGLFIECRPISVLQSDAPLEFFVCASEEYVDLSHTQIQLTVKILKEDGTLIGDTDPVMPINNFLDSLFEHISVELNNKTITPPSNSYHYRSYIETMLNYSTEAKDTHLSAGLYSKDEAGKMEDPKSKGFIERKSYFSNGMVQLSGYIHSELMSQDKYMCNGVNIRIKFYRSKAGFALLTTAADKETYKIEISDAILLVRKVKINPSILVAHEKALSKSNMKYPLNRVEIKTISLSGKHRCDFLFPMPLIYISLNFFL